MSPVRLNSYRWWFLSAQAAEELITSECWPQVEGVGMFLWAGTGVRMRLAIAVTPFWVWGLAISLLPHKEERFLYPVYPLVGDFLPTHTTIFILASTVTTPSPLPCIELNLR